VSDRWNANGVYRLHLFVIFVDLYARNLYELFCYWPRGELNCAGGMFSNMDEERCQNGSVNC
jgi:hypothetical protein